MHVLIKLRALSLASSSSSSYAHSNHFLIKTYVYVKSPSRHIHVRMITTVEPSALTERAQAHTPERLLSRSKRQTKSCSRASFSVNLHLTSVCSCRLQFTGSTQKGVFMHYLFIVNTWQIKQCMMTDVGDPQQLFQLHS